MKHCCKILVFAKRKGVTLIELLVVITIIGILVAIMAPDFRNYTQKTDLSNTVKLVQSTLFEAFSLARSRGKHFLVLGSKGEGFIEIHKCEDLGCTRHSIMQDPDDPRGRRLDFLGKNVILDQDLRVQFLSPHGDIAFPNQADTVEDLVLKIGTEDQYKEIKIYKKSGLIQILP